MSNTLNPQLIKQQGLTDEEVKHLENLHEQREELFERMEGTDSTTTSGRTALHEYADDLRDLEFAMQRAWKFEENADYHSWWFQVPHCVCPKIDNWDAVGSGMHVVRLDCPVHGTKI